MLGTGTFPHGVLMTKIQTLRSRAFAHQNGRCCYCDVQMWLHQPTELLLPQRAAAKLRCTAEHLRAKSEGGAEQADNIAAACLRCNEMRHRMHPPLSPERYRAHVHRLMRARRWHNRCVLSAGLATASADGHPALRPLPLSPAQNRSDNRVDSGSFDAYVRRTLEQPSDDQG